MNTKVIYGLLVALFGYSAFLTYKFSVLENKVAAVETRQSESVTITPSAQPQPPQQPGQQSPFDQPQVDPMSPENMAANSAQTVVNFKTTEYDFGKIKEGEKVRTTFKFTNTGKEPLIITNAQGSCGCTVPSWPKEPIAVGKSGEIEVEFNSEGKSGEQTKTVDLRANAATPRLLIKGTVIPKDK